MWSDLRRIGLWCGTYVANSPALRPVCRVEAVRSPMFGVGGPTVAGTNEISES